MFFKKSIESWDKYSTQYRFLVRMWNKRLILSHLPHKKERIVLVHHNSIQREIVHNNMSKDNGSCRVGHVIRKTSNFIRTFIKRNRLCLQSNTIRPFYYYQTLIWFRYLTFLKIKVTFVFGNSDGVACLSVSLFSFNFRNCILKIVHQSSIFSLYWE